MSTTMSATDFRARCARVLDRVKRTRQEVVITRRGVPVVKVVPVPPKQPFRLGALEGEFEIVGDITKPLYTDEEWAAFERERDAQWQQALRTAAPTRVTPRRRAGARVKRAVVQR